MKTLNFSKLSLYYHPKNIYDRTRPCVFKPEHSVTKTIQNKNRQMLGKYSEKKTLSAGACLLIIITVRVLTKLSYRMVLANIDGIKNDIVKSDKR